MLGNYLAVLGVLPSLPVLLHRPLCLFQVRVRTDLQRQVSAGKPSSERSVSAAAGRADEHLHQPDTRRMDVRQDSYNMKLFSLSLSHLY